MFIRLLTFFCACVSLILPAHAAEQTKANAYQFFFKTADGQDVPLSQYRGKLLLIVNTASHCGFTPQYAELEQLYERYKDRGLVIIAVPSNDFGEQEPGTSEEVKSFAEQEYKITFPIMAKTIVRGEDAHPFYTWARDTKGVWNAPKWNFHKYLISPQGDLIDAYFTHTRPLSDKFIAAVEKHLP